MRRLRWAALTTFAALAALLPASAMAAPPENDNRANAQAVGSLPATIDGTTVEATREDTEPGSGCAAEDGTVWYRVTPGARGRVIVGLNAAGDLDAVVDVYQARRSQLTGIACEQTDENGRAQLSFSTTGTETYFIRVAPLFNSVQDTFRLNVRFAAPDATPPGPSLPRRGASGTLDRVLNPSDAYSLKLRAGRLYRFNLSSERCTSLAIYAPGTSDFESDSPVRRIGCRGYTLFTPEAGQSGRYSLLAIAPGRRGSTPYRLTAGPARADDTAPGRFIRNYQRVKDSLDARRLDVVDLYRFDVERRSDLDLRLRTNGTFTVNLLNGRGKRLDSDQGGLTARVTRGRYFAVVRAERGERGSYSLRRITRTITRTRATFEGRSRARVTPGRTVSLGAHVRPDGSGRVVVRVERFDPVAGWLFLRSYRRKTGADGDVTIPFRASTEGRWRARVTFLGSRRASPSLSGYAFLRAVTPIEE